MAKTARRTTGAVMATGLFLGAAQVCVAANVDGPFSHAHVRSVSPVIVAAIQHASIDKEWRHVFEPFPYRAGIEAVKALAATDGGGMLDRNELRFLLRTKVVDLPCHPAPRAKTRCGFLHAESNWHGLSRPELI